MQARRLLFKVWESNRLERIKWGSCRSRAQSLRFSRDAKVLMWPAWELVGSFTASFPKKGQWKFGGLWLTITFLQVRSIPSKLTELPRWARPRGSGESRTGSLFFLNLCCFQWDEQVLHDHLPYTFTWTSLSSCRSHSLQDFKGLVLLHESQKSWPPWPEWLNEVPCLQISPSSMSSCLSHCFELYFG